MLTPQDSHTRASVVLVLELEQHWAWAQAQAPIILSSGIWEAGRGLEEFLS